MGLSNDRFSTKYVFLVLRHCTKATGGLERFWEVPLRLAFQLCQAGAEVGELAFGDFVVFAFVGTAVSALGA